MMAWPAPSCPSHTPLDGDLIFAAATAEKPLTDPLTDTFQLGHAAAVCLARAIARAIYRGAHRYPEICSPATANTTAVRLPPLQRGLILIPRRDPFRAIR